MNILPQALIMTAFKKELDYHTNVARNLELARYAQAVLGCPIKALKGFYKGDSEDSLYIEFRTQDNYERLLEYAMAMGQESVLLLDANRLASLIYTDNTDKVEHLGKFKATDKQGIAGLDCYSYDAELNQYYITTGGL